MATIYLVKHGPRPDRTSAGIARALNEIATLVEPYRCRYLGAEPPAINEGEPSDSYQRVVIKVVASDGITKGFPKAGFYLVEDLRAADAGFLVRF